uniref:Uncharacterized protein n=1 Tax=Oryza barthii TaxID=65489 RepID=A0A0D3GUE3_9ORYZ
MANGRRGGGAGRGGHRPATAVADWRGKHNSGSRPTCGLGEILSLHAASAGSSPRGRRQRGRRGHRPATMVADWRGKRGDGSRPARSSPRGRWRWGGTCREVAADRAQGRSSPGAGRS